MQKEALESAGLDLYTAIKLFLTQVVRSQSIPFEIFTFYLLPEAKKRALVREAKQALKSGKYFNSVEELHADIVK